jgi:hypothetical protein
LAQTGRTSKGATSCQVNQLRRLPQRPRSDPRTPQSSSAAQVTPGSVARSRSVARYNGGTLSPQRNLDLVIVSHTDLPFTRVPLGAAWVMLLGREQSMLENVCFLSNSDCGAHIAGGLKCVNCGRTIAMGRSEFPSRNMRRSVRVMPRRRLEKVVNEVADDTSNLRLKALPVGLGGFHHSTLGRL